LALLAPRRIAYLEKYTSSSVLHNNYAKDSFFALGTITQGKRGNAVQPKSAILPADVEKLTDRLNAPVKGTGADGLKLALDLLWERRSECPGAVPVLVCHYEVVVEYDAEQAADAKIWLVKAMIEGMEDILNGTGEVQVPVAVASRIINSWGEV
jgi:DNA polymerase I-like protein with 3'-5' exonuclease and polymerase domains